MSISFRVHQSLNVEVRRDDEGYGNTMALTALSNSAALWYNEQGVDENIACVYSSVQNA